LDVSRTLSNDKIACNLPSKLSKKAQDSHSISSGLISQKDSSKLKSESGFSKSNASEVESKKSKINHKDPAHSLKKPKKSKEKSPHVVDS
jgi:hypothetical protein